MNAFSYPVAYGYAALDVLLGGKISEGLDRTVYDLAIDSDYVVKVQRSDDRARFQNMQEWLIWCKVRDTDQAKWFAPCLWISVCGRLLVMRRTGQILESQLPRRVPAYFTDFKWCNWGMLRGRPVCHDYGVSLVMDHGLNVGMKRAEW